MIRLLLNLLLGLLILTSSWTGWGWTPPAIAQRLPPTTINEAYLVSEVTIPKDLRNPIDARLGRVGRKVDLNNSSVLVFRRYRGLYPTLARKIIKNAPYDVVEDVLEIPGLSAREREILEANLDNFVVMPPEPALIEGGDRINPGVYK
ncbi:MAG: photosystem II complex extrinsic protein PsbU [Cyanobacteria bacterium J06626_23]